ncbi:8-amino-7-oxononanoate synthase [soil metagenome]
MSGLDAFLAEHLAKVEAAGLRRSLRVLESEQGPEVMLDGRSYVNFSSNDYLGLAAHPSLREAAAESLEKYGAGAGASRLISGNHIEHERLEDVLAKFKGTEAALTFSTGYAAAVGAIPALAGEGDVVILDKLCHASLVDGARLSGAALRVFPHNHLEKLESHLRWAREKYPQGRVLVLTESVFSMDGDVAPLAEIVALKERHGAWLMVDEAHAVGVIGREGRGLADELGLADRIEVQMGTLGKALGSAGAYICGSRLLRNFLINSARSFIFSTAPPPHLAAASRAAVELLQEAEGEKLMSCLWKNIEEVRGILKSGKSRSAIFPVIIGGEAEAVEYSRRLLAAGLLIPAIRYPTVAKGTARLRVTVTASHNREALNQLSTNYP